MADREQLKALIDELPDERLEEIETAIKSAINFYSQIEIDTPVTTPPKATYRAKVQLIYTRPDFQIDID